MRAWLCLVVLLAGCADTPSQSDPGAVDEAPEAARTWPLAFADDAQAGTQQFTGSFAPHESAVVQGQTGVDADGQRSHALDLPTGRPVFASVHLAHDGDEDALSASISAPAGAVYSRACCIGPDSDEERHLLLQPGDEAAVRIIQIVASAQVEVAYTVTVSWTAPADVLYAGIPVAFEMGRNDTVTVQPSDDGLNPVFVFGPDGDLLTVIPSGEVVFTAADPGEHVVFHQGHGAPARFEVNSTAQPGHRLLGFTAETIERTVDAGLEQDVSWEDEVDQAPLQVRVCGHNEGYQGDQTVAVTFPNSEGVEMNFNVISPQGIGFCTSTPVGDERLSPGTYTTSYTSAGGQGGRVTTTFVHLAR